jgi:hypothetical protein
MGMDFIGIGDTCRYDKTEKSHNGARFIQLFWRDGLLTGANFIDMCAEAGIIKNAVVKGLLQNRHDSDIPVPVVQNLLIKKILAEVNKA